MDVSQYISPKVVILSILIVFIIGGIKFYMDISSKKYGTVTIRYGGTEITKINVEIADTPAKRMMGYMFRKEAPNEGEGILFVFNKPGKYGFWMKNVTFPLDIAFINSRREIIQITTMEPCKSTTCRTYKPNDEIIMALETKAYSLVNKNIPNGATVEVTYTNK